MTGYDPKIPLWLAVLVITVAVAVGMLLVVFAAVDWRASF